jgi:hypothetical protein
MEFTLTIPEEQAQTVFEAFKTAYGYSETILDAEGKPTSNPLSVEDFARQQVINFITETTKAYLIKKAREQVDAQIKSIDLSGIN